MYLLLKHLHLTFVVLSFLLFLVRGILMLRHSPAINNKLLKITPHIVNTFMIISGIAIAVYLNLSPGNSPWLTAKLVGLVVFILLGVFAFKARTHKVRLSLWLLALLVFVQIMNIAVSKNPWGLLAGLAS